MAHNIGKDKLVSITYRISDEEGKIVEQLGIPIDYVHGVDDHIFPGIIRELEGKVIGDEVLVVLSPEEGFGIPDTELIIVDDVDNAPPEYRVIGAIPTFQSENGDRMEMVVTKIGDGKITVDGNHPFAGKTMTFLVNNVGVRDIGGDVAAGINTPAPTTLQ